MNIRPSKLKKTSECIKQFWNEQALEKGVESRATTNDIWLREIEVSETTRVLRGIKKKAHVLDIGCGNGFGTIGFARAFPASNFVGGDFAEVMVQKANAALDLQKTAQKNTRFEIMDVLDLSKFKNKFDVVVSDRCLINLPTVAYQKKAIEEIVSALHPHGFFVMIENFMEGHNNMNKLRKHLTLPEIPVRWHNTFFNENFVKDFIIPYFDLIERKNISSVYYLITRAVYSKMCQMTKTTPDYNHQLHQIAAGLGEDFGDYGPIKLLLLRKK